MNYRRSIASGATYFFTICLQNRRSTLLHDRIDVLRNGFHHVRCKHPFKIDAIVVMPDHVHLLMTLPPNHSDFSLRLNLIKGYFSRHIQSNEIISAAKKNKRERNIWQRRFWEHLICNDSDYENHVNYIHNNPVKHGYVSKAIDWKFSSIHQYINDGIVPKDWGYNGSFKDIEYGEM